MLNGYPDQDFIHIFQAEIGLQIFDFAPEENPEYSRSDPRSDSGASVLTIIK